MKARMIREAFWTDEKIVQLSPFARLLFIATWQLADDHGRFEWEPGRMRLQLFPMDAVDVEALGSELVSLGLIWLYPVSRKRFACLPNFLRHQKLHTDRESKFPAPPKSLTDKHWAEVGQIGPDWAEVGGIPSPNPTHNSKPNPTINPTQPNKDKIFAPRLEDKPPEPSKSHVIFTFADLAGPVKTWDMTEAYFNQLKDAYPTLDHHYEIKRSNVWMVSNPAKKKTARGMTKFLNAWFDKAQNDQARNALKSFPAQSGQQSFNLMGETVSFKPRPWRTKEELAADKKQRELDGIKI